MCESGVCRWNFDALFQPSRRVCMRFGAWDGMLRMCVLVSVLWSFDALCLPQQVGLVVF
jgi:hypothetical protein